MVFLSYSSPFSFGAHRSGNEQQQLPAAVFGDGLRISCAKCSKLRRDPSGVGPVGSGGGGGGGGRKSFSKSCTKKERYWFCESCVTGSPAAFTGRGIGVCRRDGKWKMATVRVREGRRVRERDGG